MSGDVKQGWRSSPRWMKIALILSLAANFVVIGAAVGATMHIHDARPDHGRGMERLIGALPENRQDAARRVAADAAPALRAAREERRAARRAYAEALAASPFDEAAFDAALARMIQTQEASRLASHQLMKDLVAGLSDAERAALAEQLNRRRGGRREYRRDRDRSE